MGRNPRYEVRNEYAYWLATPRRLRISLNLPSTEAEFAEMKGVNVRTMRRWRENQDFLNLVEQRKMEVANSAPNSAIASVGPPRAAVDPRTVKRLSPPEPAVLADDPAYDPGVSVDEQKYLQVKDTLVQMAMDGNQGAIDLYLKHYGKPFVEAEQNKLDDYAKMSDEDIIADFCRYAGVDAISAWLANMVAEVE